MKYKIGDKIVVAARKLATGIAPCGKNQRPDGAEFNTEIVGEYKEDVYLEGETFYLIKYDSGWELESLYALIPGSEQYISGKWFGQSPKQIF